MQDVEKVAEDLSVQDVEKVAEDDEKRDCVNNYPNIISKFAQSAACI